MPAIPEDHDGITGVTFTSGGHRLLGTLYLARGSEPKPAVRAAGIAPGPLLVVHGTADRCVPVGQARQLASRAGQPCRYAEIGGAGHDFAWHRGCLRELVTDWLAEAHI